MDMTWLRAFYMGLLVVVWKDVIWHEIGGVSVWMASRIMDTRMRG